MIEGAVGKGRHLVAVGDVDDLGDQPVAEGEFGGQPLEPLSIDIGGDDGHAALSAALHQAAAYAARRAGDDGGLTGKTIH